MRPRALVDVGSRGLGNLRTSGLEDAARDVKNFRDGKTP